MTLSYTMPPQSVGRRAPGGRQGKEDAKGAFTAGTPQNDFRLDVTGVGKEKDGRGESPRGGHKCPNLGPTRQDTLLYFKTNGRRPNTERHKQRTGYPRSCSSGPPKTAPSALPVNATDDQCDDGSDVESQTDELLLSEQSSCKRQGVSQDNASYQRQGVSQDNASYQRQGVSQDNASYQRLCVSSLVLRRESTSVVTSRPGSYVSERYFRPSSESMVSLSRYRMSRRKERIITPSKHGYHPRSHSPTFKRLLQASDKLNHLLETLSTSVIDSSSTQPAETRPETRTATSDTEVESEQGSSSADDTSTNSTPEQSVGLYDITFEPCKGHRPNFGTRSEFRDSDLDISPKKHHVTPLVCLQSDIKVDYRHNGQQGPELHFFLPNIVPTSSDRVNLRTPDAADNQETTSSRTSKSLPKLSIKENSYNSSKPRNGYSKRTRIVTKRSLSPAKPVNKDKQRKGRVLEEKEPFLRGESLKERLEDFPTLVSLDTS